MADALTWPEDLGGEVAVGGFRVEVAQGEWIEIPSPAHLSATELGLAVINWRQFMHNQGHQLPAWHADALGRAYVDTYGLPDEHGALRLQQLVARFRREVRADLAAEYPGTDLSALYAAGRWKTILDYVDMLPQNSRLAGALANDPEIAEELARLQLESEGDDAAPWTPNFIDWDLKSQMMGDLLWEARQMKQLLFLQATQKTPKTEEPFPRPRTGIDDAREAFERDLTIEFISMFGFSEDDM